VEEYQHVLVDTLGNTSQTVQDCGAVYTYTRITSERDATTSLGIEKIWSGEIHAILVFTVQIREPFQCGGKSHFSMKELRGRPFECEGIGGRTI